MMRMMLRVLVLQFLASVDHLVRELYVLGVLLRMGNSGRCRVRKRLQLKPAHPIGQLLRSNPIINPSTTTTAITID